jgi:AbiV family abortive infection protein
VSESLAQGSKPDHDPLLEAYSEVLRSALKLASLADPVPPLRDPEYGTLATMAFANSLSLYRSAIELGKVEEYGHAVSLLVLALEEAGKALTLRFIAYGIFSTNIADMGVRPFVDEDALWCHRCKHAIAGALAMGTDSLSLMGYDESWFDERSKHISDSEIVAEPARMAEVIPPLDPPGREVVLARLQANPELANRMIRTFRLFRRLDSLKMRGFYVDYSEREAVSPRAIGLSEFEQIRVQVLELASPLIQFVGGEPPLEIARVLRDGMNSIRFPPVTIVCKHRGSRTSSAPLV